MKEPNFTKIAIYTYLFMFCLIMGLGYYNKAFADEPIPKEFYMDYTPDIQLVLEYDQCDKSDTSKGWAAYAIELSTNRKATGCWGYSQNETVIIHISIGTDETGGERYLDYQLYKSKFKPRY